MQIGDIERVNAIEVYWMVSQTCTLKNVVHRDLKPSNIVIENASGRSVIVGFVAPRAPARPP